MAKILEAKQLTDKLKKAIEVKLSHSPKLTLASLRPDLKDYSSQLFIAQQEKIASELGPNIDYRLILLKASLSQGEVLKTIAKLNADSAVTAIALTKPFPKDWKDQDLFKAIDPNKDIEGISPYNLGRLALGNALFIPPTVLSILELIKDTGLKLRGKRVTIVGSSNIIGKPLSLLLADQFATVSITHIATYEAGDLEYYVSQADVLISAAGVPELIEGDWIKQGALVVDVGVGQKEEKTIGDVEFEKAKNKASFITPVPGGVGKLTTMFLFHNLLIAGDTQKR